MYEKLRITGLEDPVVVPPDPLEPPEPLDGLEPDDADFEEPEELPLAVDELLEPVVPVLEVDDEPAFVLLFALVAEPEVPLPPPPPVPDAAPWPLDPPAPAPPWPLVLPVVPRPVPVVAPEPPTRPIRASTWQRTVALLALSIVPFSTTTISTSPESISTKWIGDLVSPSKFAGR